MSAGKLLQFAIEAHDAVTRIIDTVQQHPADAHETYFQANGENYRIRIERIPQEKADGKSKNNV